MGLKEKLLSEILTKGIERCHQRLNIASIQQRHNAYEQRVVRIEVTDVAIPPTDLRVRDGRIENVLDATKPDVSIRFKYLDSFLDVLVGKYKIEQVFAYGGFRAVRKSFVPFSTKFGIKDQWERCVEYTGDIGRDSFFLREILKEYLSVLREILMEMPTMRYLVRPIAKVKRVLYKDESFDISKSQGDGFSTVPGGDANAAR